MAPQNPKTGACVNYLQKVLTKTELSHVSRASTEKINKYISSIFEDLNALKEVHEAKGSRFEESSTELQKQVEGLNSELQKSREKIVALENEISTIKEVRNNAIDEKNNLGGVLVRNNAEIERYKSEIVELTNKLQEAVAAKCEALELNNDIQSREFLLQQREKRMEEEKLLQNTRISSLTEEIDRLTSELQTASLNNNAKIICLESKLLEVNSELNKANELICQLRNENQVLSNQVNVLTNSILKEKDFENVSANYDKEIYEKEKISNMFKNMYEEATAKINEITEKNATLEKLLHEAVSKCSDLEARKQEIENQKDELLKEKNEQILCLKNELENVKKQLKEADAQGIDMALSKLTPNAAIFNKLIKSDMSLTQLYSELVKMEDQLVKEKEENKQLSNKYNKILEELKKNEIDLQKSKNEQKEISINNREYVSKIEEITAENNKLSNEITQLSTLCNQHEVDKTRSQKELADLGRQICFLLSKISKMEENSVQNISDVSMNDSTNSISNEENCSSKIISKTLVTFSDIQELQSNNQKLLSKIRELTEKQEKIAPIEYDFDKDSFLKEIEELKYHNSELIDLQNTQTKMVNSLIRQRDTYKKLYNDFVKGKRLELSSITNMDCNEKTTESIKAIEENSTKVTDLENKLKNTQKQLDALDKEYKTYKEEKQMNEKILYDQVESMRTEIANLTFANSKYISRADFNSEQIKHLEASITDYKKQINLLEEKSEIYNKSNAKYEISLQQLLHEVLETKKNLAAAEVQIEKYKLECKLKTDHEIRLKNENEMWSREKRGQDMLLANLELIKVCLERRNVEKTLNLESSLKKYKQEYEALKKKNKEDEDKLKELEENFKSLTETTNTRLQEERNATHIMRNEIQELRQNLANRNKSNEELTRKLNMVLSPSNSNNSDNLNKLRELEDKLFEKENEIKLLRDEISLNKSVGLEIKQKWENIQKLIKIIENKQFTFKRDCENKIREFGQRIHRVKVNCNKVRNKNFRPNLEIKNEIFSQSQFNDISDKCEEALQLELQKMSEIVVHTEQKYANEMLLHSEDLQKINELKEELLSKDKQLKEIVSSKDSVIKKMEIDKIACKKAVESLKNENQILLSRFEELSTQNSLLLDQIQSFSSQITQSSSQICDVGNESNVSNMSVGEDETLSSEKMLKIIKFLRKEKDMAVAKSNTLQAESARLQSQIVVIEKQLENTKMALNHQREIAASNQPMNQQSDILKKVGTLDALTDSNRLLRSERDSLLNKVEELTQSVNSFERDVPIQIEKISELTLKCSTLESENATLKADITRWRNKVTVLAERANKASPEDWKRLQTEREALAKMLTAEKEKVRKLSSELASLKTDVEENSALSQQNETMKEQLKKLQEQFQVVNKDLLKLTDDSLKVKSELKSSTEKNQELNAQLSVNDSIIADLKNKEMQIKKIAKKYKLQYEELLQKMEAQTIEAANSENIQKSEEQLALLKSSLDAEKTNSEKLKSDLNSSIDREDKAKQLLKIAKSKIVQLTDEKNTLTTKIETIEKKEESDVSKQINDKDNALAQKTSEIEGLKARILALESQLSNLQNLERPQRESSTTRTNSPGAAQSRQREAESQSASTPQPQAQSPEHMPSSSSRSSSAQEVDDSDSGPVTGNKLKMDLPQVSLVIPRLETAAIASATNRAAHSTDGSNGGVSSATTDSRPMKRSRPSEPNSSQKRLKQTDDAEYEAPSSSRCDDDDDTTTQRSIVDEDEEDAANAVPAQGTSEQPQIESSSSGLNSKEQATGSDGDETVQPSTGKHYATRSNEGSSEALGSASLPESTPRHRQRNRGRARGRSIQRGPNPPIL